MNTIQIKFYAKGEGDAFTLGKVTQGDNFGWINVESFIGELSALNNLTATKSSNAYFVLHSSGTALVNCILSMPLPTLATPKGTRLDTTNLASLVQSASIQA